MFQTKAETHILNSTIFLPKNGNIYDIMWENMVEPDRPQMTIQYGAGEMQFVCQIIKATIVKHNQIFNTY